MSQGYNQLNLFNDFVNKYGPSNVKMLPHNPSMQPSVFTNAGSVEHGVPVNWAKQWYGYSKPRIQPKVQTVSGPIKGTGGPLLSGAELLRLWYGKDEHGAVGPGRALLEQTPWGQAIFGKPQMTPEQIKSNEITRKFIKDVFGGQSNKQDNTDKNTDTILRGAGAKSGNKTTAKPAGVSQAQALALAQQLGDGIPMDTQQEADTQQANINAINDYVSKLQEINQPYIESLQRFADNYGDLYNQNQLYNRRMRDLSAITGSPLWYQSAKDYNPLEVEATKIDLQKKIQDAQAGDLNAINEIMGNLAMAQEMGLSPEAAFANKNLLTAMTMRDRNLTNREIAQLNNAAKLQIALQNAQNRLAVQNLRNQGGMTNALIYAGQYGQPAVGLNQQGLPSNVPASYDVMLQSAHNKNNR